MLSGHPGLSVARLIQHDCDLSTMKSLKQTRLSFAPVSKNETPTRSNQVSTAATPMASTESPAKTPRPKKATQATNGRGRNRALDCVEIPKPPRRSSRPQTVLKSSPNRASPKKAAAKASGSSPAQSRKPSLKRKLSPRPGALCKKADGGCPIGRRARVSECCQCVPQPGPRIRKWLIRTRFTATRLSQALSSEKASTVFPGVRLDTINLQFRI